jgi:ribonuclease HIII
VSDTLVFQVTPPQALALERALRESLPMAEWRRVDHARFALKGDGISLVCYLSGKLVVQGKDCVPFAQRHLGGLSAAGPKSAEPPVPFDGPTIGSDEAGKGDYFGPLVVAAVYGEPADAEELRQMGVADSKTLRDERMFPMAERIEHRLDCEVRMLMPPDYNRAWHGDPNVNHLLADLHAEALAALLERHPEATVVVDRFADEDVLASRLRRRLEPDAPLRLVQVPKAEAHPIVGAASVVARVHFVEGFKKCQDETGTDLHLGAGEPVDAAARRVAAIGGRALLEKVAKLHFKNTQRLGNVRP